MPQTTGTTPSRLVKFHQDLSALLPSITFVIGILSLILFSIFFNLNNKTENKNLNYKLAKKVSLQVVNGSFNFFFLGIVSVFVSISKEPTQQQAKTQPPKNMLVLGLYLFIQIVSFFSIVVLWIMYVKCMVELEKKKAKDPEKTSKKQKQYRTGIISLFSLMWASLICLMVFY